LIVYIEDNEVLVFNFTFHLLWTRRGSAGVSAAFSGYRELRYIEKRRLKPCLAFDIYNDRKNLDT